MSTESLKSPEAEEELRSIAEGCKGHACLMPMRRRAGAWAPDASGWGLLDAQTGTPIDPVALVSDEQIEMTGWELHDFTPVQIVRDQLEKTGRKLMSWQGDPSVDPSIWFIGVDGPEWVVVRAVRYPQRAAKLPE